VFAVWGCQCRHCSGERSAGDPSLVRYAAVVGNRSPTWVSATPTVGCGRPKSGLVVVRRGGQRSRTRLATSLSTRDRSVSTILIVNVEAHTLELRVTHIPNKWSRMSLEQEGVG
jgi:hypothetical protein